MRLSQPVAPQRVIFVLQDDAQRSASRTQSFTEATEPGRTFAAGCAGEETSSSPSDSLSDSGSSSSSSLPCKHETGQAWLAGGRRILSQHQLFTQIQPQ